MPRPSALPSSPPPEVLAAVERAGRRAAELAAAGRELHFRSDPASGRVVIAVRDLDGAVLRHLAPSDALAVLSGGALECPLSGGRGGARSSGGARRSRR